MVTPADLASARDHSTLIVVGHYGLAGTGKLLIFSQVILSIQLSFAVVPLILFTNDKLKLGPFANGPFIKLVGWTLAIVIAGLNAYLVFGTFFPKLVPGAQ